MTRSEQAADVAAAASVATAVGLGLTEWNEILQLVAGLFAALSGMAALVYHVIGIHRRVRKDPPEPPPAEPQG
jgi:hypothetical protein